MKTSMVAFVILASLTGCSGMKPKPQPAPKIEEPKLIGCLNSPISVISKDGKPVEAILPCLRSDGVLLWGQQPIPAAPAVAAVKPEPAKKHKGHAR
jgi:hypothetical protein